MAAIQWVGVGAGLYFAVKGRWWLAAASLAVAYVPHKGGPANVLASLNGPRYAPPPGGS